MKRRAATGGAEAHCNRAAAALARGDFATAARAYQEAIRRDTRNPDAYNNLGVLSAQRNDLDAAIRLFEVGIRLAPEGDARENLVKVLCLRGAERFRRRDLDGAAEDFKRHWELDPKSAQAATNLGLAFAESGLRKEALELYARAIDLDPNHLLAHINLGALLLALGRFDEAAGVLSRALPLAPDDARLLINLGAAEEKRNNLVAAAELARRALETSPESAEAHNNLGNALLHLGEIAGSLEHLRQAVALSPSRPEIQSSFLQALNHAPDVDPEIVAAEHRRVGGVHRAGFSPTVLSVHPRGTEPLRVGYLSPDLRAHSVAYFFEPLLAAHDHSRVEVTCYADCAVSDRVTERLRSSAARWRNVAGIPDGLLAEKIRADGIEVLVDLSGHTAANRLSLFARRAAPVQVTYLGYPNTTGLDTMDYRVTDAIADPAGASDRWHTEKLIRLDGGFLCYAPPFPAGDGPAVSAGPVARNGYVTFGSFNNLAKVNPQVIAAWAALLANVPDAHLLLKARALGEASVRERLWNAFAAHGVARERIELVAPIRETADHFAAYSRIDIGLDPFPYNGTTTTCEAMWMGVPVVTVAGYAHAGRVGASLLNRVGLDELAPPTVPMYLHAAAALANDRDRLRDLRATLRDRMMRSPLVDGRRVAHALELAFARAVERAT